MECKWGICFKAACSITELIDTLWNVNTLEFTMPFDTSRINRYIMECKFNAVDWVTVIGTAN